VLPFNRFVEIIFDLDENHDLPKISRLEAPGVVHHVMTREIQRRNVFRDNKDRKDVIERPEILCPAFAISL
jgi:hypothetical protein